MTSPCSASYPIVRDVENVLAGSCCPAATKLHGDAPTYELVIDNGVSTPYWQDELGDLLLEEDGSPIELA